MVREALPSTAASASASASASGSDDGNVGVGQASKSTAAMEAAAEAQVAGWMKPWRRFSRYFGNAPSLPLPVGYWYRHGETK